MYAIAQDAGQYIERPLSVMMQVHELVPTQACTSWHLEEATHRSDQFYAVPLFVFSSLNALKAHFADDAAEHEDPTFRDLLAAYVQRLYPVDGVLPIDPHYGAFPFVVFRSYTLQEIRHHIFTTSQLLTSHELSVLNMILMESPAS